MPDASDADPAAANDLAFPALDSTQSRLIADAVARAARQGRQAIPKTAKNTFSLADYQTPFRNQGERSTSWAFAGAAALEAAYKRRYGISLSLLAEYEVIADVFHKCDPVGAHVLLVIGFDRNRQVFLAKNSWGENAFIEIGYRNDPDWDIRSGFYLVDVRDPALVQREAAWLGYWRMSIKGLTGRLLLRRHCDLRDSSDQPALGTFRADGGELEVRGSFRDGGRTLNMVLAENGQKRALGALAGGEILARLAMPGGRTADGVMRDGSPVMLSRHAVPAAGAVKTGRTM